MEDLNVYSGKLTYKDICFDFVYDKQELRLIPPTDKKREIWNWKMKELSPGVFTMGDPLTLDSPYIEGTINETAQKVFRPKKYKCKHFVILSSCVSSMEKRWFLFILLSQPIQLLIF